MVKILGFTIGREKKEDAPAVVVAEPEFTPERRPLPSAVSIDFAGSGGYAPTIRTIYNGEKNFGELGPVLKHVVDHDALGQRAWQLDIESEVVHNLIKQKGRWVLGSGLKLQCEPQVEVLKSEGINLKPEDFNKIVEALWKNYSFKSPIADYSNMVPLHKIAKRAFKNMDVRGDVLAILRIGKQNNVTVQLIDGHFVSTPAGLSLAPSADKLVNNCLGYDFVGANGNRIRHGVEIDDTGQHIAYHVRVGVGLQWDRISARDSRGSLRAFLVCGSEHRLENVRGIPVFTASMESAKQLDEYTSATLGSAVERQRIAYFITHERGTEEIDPRQKQLAKVIGTGGNLDMPVDAFGNQLANDIAVSTNKQTFNLGAGTGIESPESKQELKHKEFYTTLSNSIAATTGIPPEVASQMYGGSYSASRAATNGFQYSLNIDRPDFGDQFYQRVYNLQLDVWVLSFKVQAPGYLDALMKGNETILSAYRYANWVGDPVPQIDELKEVQAARLKLGTAANHLPMSTAEAVTQNLGEGNFLANLIQFARELEDAKKVKIPVEDLITKKETEGSEGE